MLSRYIRAINGADPAEIRCVREACARARLVFEFDTSPVLRVRKSREYKDGHAREYMRCSATHINSPAKNASLHVVFWWYSWGKPYSVYVSAINPSDPSQGSAQSGAFYNATLAWRFVAAEIDAFALRMALHKRNSA